MDAHEAYEDALRHAAELAAVFGEHQVVTEAELAARGIHPVTIAHGCGETGEDAKLIYEVAPQLARGCGALAGTRGGNEHTTYLFTGPAAETSAAAFIAAVAEVAPRWWRVTATAWPVWR